MVPAPPSLPPQPLAYATQQYDPAAPSPTRYLVVGIIGIFVTLFLIASNAWSTAVLWPLLDRAKEADNVTTPNYVWGAPRRVEPASRLTSNAVATALASAALGVLAAIFLLVGSVRMIQFRRNAIAPCRRFALLQITLAAFGLIWSLYYGVDLAAAMGVSGMSEGLNVVGSTVGFCLLMIWPTVVSWAIVGQNAKLALTR